VDGGPRITNYDGVAARFDRRYELYPYDGVRETLLSFLGSAHPAALEVGCGTGHWLETMGGHAGRLCGLEPSMPMLERARIALAGRPSGGAPVHLVQGAAEQLPWRDATFDRIVCVNALHHFRDRVAFFAEARRVLRSGGGVMTIAKDPHAERDTWWVYDYFVETRDIDRLRYAPVRILRGELARSGFAWAESFEADHIDVTHPASEALASGVIDRSFTSQLTVLTDEEFAAGVARVRAADEAADGRLRLVSDFHLFATVGWLT
jgi:ubiquinone/menaquinone biosynthesis C-methylase UbiE